jgi:hypothetical protein
MSSESNASATTAQPESAKPTPGGPQSTTAQDGVKPGNPQWKDNNPKDGFGVLKAGVTSYLYMPVLYEQTVGMCAGGFKYGAHNFLAIPPRSSVYTDAAIRHIGAFVGGEMWDPHAGKDVKVRHVIAAMNSLHVLAAAIINEAWIDDRPPPSPPGHLESLEESLKAIARNNPEPVARYLADGKRGPGRLLAAQASPVAPSGTKTSATEESFGGLTPTAAAAFERSQDQASRERDHEALQPPARDVLTAPAMLPVFVPCEGCDGHECDDGCAYPGVASRPPPYGLQNPD